MTPETQPLPPSSNGSNKLRVSSIFLSPRLFNGFSPKGLLDSLEAASASVMSPTSILGNKSSSPTGHLFFSVHKHSKKPPFDHGAIGLAIVGEKDKVMSSAPLSRMALFGSKLNIQVPSNNSSSSSSTSPMVFPNSPVEFGIKNRDSQLALFSPKIMAAVASSSSSSSSSSPRVVIGRSISASEVELSEDYTCVITHGPNPRTTCIFDDCVIESAGNEFIVTAASAVARKEMSTCVPGFLNYCNACKKDLGQGKKTSMHT